MHKVGSRPISKPGRTIANRHFTKVTPFSISLIYIDNKWTIFSVDTNPVHARTRVAIYIHRGKLVYSRSFALFVRCGSGFTRSLARSLAVPLGQSQVAEEAPTHASRMPTHKRVRPHYSGPCFTSAPTRGHCHTCRGTLSLSQVLSSPGILSRNSRENREGN